MNGLIVNQVGERPWQPCWKTENRREILKQVLKEQTRDKHVDENVGIREKTKQVDLLSGIFKKKIMLHIYAPPGKAWGSNLQYKPHFSSEI